MPAPWDIGRPQPAFLRLAERGLLAGRLLDAGCGSGEQTLLAAGSGADAVGVDVSPLAIERARAKAAARGIQARFKVASALSLNDLGLTFDTVIDVGLFHSLDDEARVAYVASLASVLRPGGHCFLMCFSERQPGNYGPRRVTQDELRAAFSDGWTIISIEPDVFDVNRGTFGNARPSTFDTGTAQAWLAAICRIQPS
jgi:cyclopropane fatty-acyl-phospholipid synthase-like methyltransferase